MEKQTKLSEPTSEQCKSNKHCTHYLEGKAKRVPIPIQGLGSPNRVPNIRKGEGKCVTPIQTFYLTPQKMPSVKCLATPLLKNTTREKTCEASLSAQSSYVSQTANRSIHFSCTPGMGTSKNLSFHEVVTSAEKNLESGQIQTSDKVTENGVLKTLGICSARRVPVSNQRPLAPHLILVTSTSEPVPVTPSGRQSGVASSARRVAVSPLCPSNITPRTLFSKEEELSPAIPRYVDGKKLSKATPLNVIPENIIATPSSSCHTQDTRKHKPRTRGQTEMKSTSAIKRTPRQKQRHT